eukprot:scaffold2188_cov102-Isochrysis_galbana.AAC.11
MGVRGSEKRTKNQWERAEGECATGSRSASCASPASCFTLYSRCMQPSSSPRHGTSAERMVRSGLKKAAE